MPQRIPPIAPYSFAAFPILALLATNIKEVDILVGIRPLIVSLIITTFIHIPARILLKNWPRAGVVTVFILTLFFSYGHIYALLEVNPIFGVNLGRHRYLAVIFGIALCIGLWWTALKAKNIPQVYQLVNVAGIVLLIFPAIQIAAIALMGSINEAKASELIRVSDSQLTPNKSPLPDIYYIVLDAHTRQDALIEDFDFDNAAYLDELRGLGFYVADCSRSNYGYTQGSIAAALNMDYIPGLFAYMQELELGDEIWVLLKQSRVRQQLEAIGYKTIAFDTGYEWSRLTDADVYLSLGSDSYTMQAISPFESMLIKSTAGLILSDYQNQLLRAGFQEINYPYDHHIQLQRFILEQLPKISLDPDPKFVFVHIMIPHGPFVFGPDGEILTDDGFYSGEKAGPVNDEYRRIGYINQVQFIDQEIAEILNVILTQSKTPPIIILHGDHGLQGDNRFEILNAYLLPGGESPQLYSTISPVNSFRVVFDTYFGTSYSLLEDISFSNENEIVPETSPVCIGQ